MGKPKRPLVSDVGPPKSSAYSESIPTKIGDLRDHFTKSPTTSSALRELDGHPVPSGPLVHRISYIPRLRVTAAKDSGPRTTGRRDAEIKSRQLVQSGFNVLEDHLREYSLDSGRLTRRLTQQSILRGGADLIVNLRQENRELMLLNDGLRVQLSLISSSEVFRRTTLREPEPTLWNQKPDLNIEGNFFGLAYQSPITTPPSAVTGIALGHKQSPGDASDCDNETSQEASGGDQPYQYIASTSDPSPCAILNDPKQDSGQVLVEGGESSNELTRQEVEGVNSSDSSNEKQLQENNRLLLENEELREQIRNMMDQTTHLREVSESTDATSQPSAYSDDDDQLQEAAGTQFNANIAPHLPTFDNSQTPVIVYPEQSDKSYVNPNCSANCVQPDDVPSLEREFPNGGVLVSVYHCNGAKRWLEEHLDHPIWQKKPPYIGGPLPLVLSACVEAFAIFASGKPQHIDFAQLLARTAGFPVIVRDREDDPTASLQTPSDYTRRAHSASTEPSDNDQEGGNNQGSNDSDRSSDPGGDSRNTRNNSRGGGGSRDPHKRDNNGNDGNGSEDNDGNSGPPHNTMTQPTALNSWKEHPENQNTHTVDIPLLVKSGRLPPVTLDIRYNYRFATRSPSSVATECPIKGVPSNDNAVVIVEPMTILTEEKMISIDKSYGCLTMMTDQDRGVIADKKYHPQVIGAKSFGNSLQVGGSGTIALVNPSFAGTYMRTQSDSSLCTQDKACPEWIVQENGAPMVSSKTKHGRSVAVSYCPSELHQRHRIFQDNKLEVKFGMSAKVAPPLVVKNQETGSSSGKALKASLELPCISFVFRNQITLWIAGADRKIPAYGMTLVQSLYVTDVQTPHELMHFSTSPLEIDLKAPRSMVLQPGDFNNPEGTAISVSEATFNNYEKPTKLKKPSQEYSEILPLQNHLLVESEVYDPLWRKVLWPNLTRELKACAGSDSKAFPVFKLEFTRKEVSESPRSSNSSASKRKSNWRLPLGTSKKGKEKEIVNCDLEAMNMD